jgi:Condensation domain
MSTESNQITHANHPPFETADAGSVEYPNRAAAIEGLTPEQRSLLTLLLRKRVTASPFGMIERVSRDRELPLSFAQESRLAFERFARDHSVPLKPFQATLGFRLAGLFNAAAMESAVSEIVRRHEVFRTNFHDQEGRFVQVISPNAVLRFGVADFQHLTLAEQERSVLALTQEEARHPFDFTRDLLLRATLLYLSPTDHAVILTTSHIIFDGWSQNLLLKELRDLYVTFSDGEVEPISEPLVQFADFAHWQRRYLQGEKLETLVSYWKRQLQGLEIVPVMELPFGRQLPAVCSYEAGFLPLKITTGLLQSLRDLSSRNRVTMFMLLVAAVKVLLRCYTGKDDIGLITVVANRNQSDTESVIGYFANHLVLRTDLSGDPRFSDVLQSVRKVATEAYAHQDLPFSVLLEVLGGGNRSRKPYILFNMTSVDESEAMEIPGLNITPLHIIEPPQIAAPGLEFHVTQGVAEMNVRMTYEIERFDAATATQILRHLFLLLEKIVTDPDQRLSDLACIIEEKQIAA